MCRVLDLGLAPEQIKELLKQGSQVGYPPPPQFGPLRWFDTEMRCSSRGCGSPTHCKLEGIPRCGMHALKKMNEMLYEIELTGGINAEASV
jgi:hypothetical protein